MRKMQRKNMQISKVMERGLGNEESPYTCLGEAKVNGRPSAVE